MVAVYKCMVFLSLLFGNRVARKLRHVLQPVSHYYRCPIIPSATLLVYWPYRRSRKFTELAWLANLHLTMTTRRLQWFLASIVTRLAAGDFQ